LRAVAKVLTINEVVAVTAPGIEQGDSSVVFSAEQAGRGKKTDRPSRHARAAEFI
jgi:hypothetical protein